MLARLGDDVEIICAHDGGQALTLLFQSSTLPDIILLDLNMPGVNGLEFLEEWSTKRGNLAPVVIVLTSSDEPRDRELATAHDCVQDYFIKPLSIDNLTILASFLGRSSPLPR